VSQERCAIDLAAGCGGKLLGAAAQMNAEPATVDSTSHDNDAQLPPHCRDSPSAVLRRSRTYLKEPSSMDTSGTAASSCSAASSSSAAAAAAPSWPLPPSQPVPLLLPLRLVLP
jgi:hypothetical protein